MNRRELVKLALTQSALAAWSSKTSVNARTKNVHAPLTLQNAYFELQLEPGTGLSCKLVHRDTGVSLADGFYSYSFGTPVFGDVREEGASVVLRGRTEYGVDISHRFTVDPATSWIEEEIELSNSSAFPLDLHDVRAGFVLPVVFAGDKVQGPWARFEFTAIPFRREPSGHKAQYSDFSLKQILTQQCSSELWSGDTDGDPCLCFRRMGMDGRQSRLPDLQVQPRRFGVRNSGSYCLTAGRRGIALGWNRHLSRDSGARSVASARRKSHGLE